METQSVTKPMKKCSWCQNWTCIIKICCNVAKGMKGIKDNLRQNLATEKANDYYYLAARYNSEMYKPVTKLVSKFNEH